MEKTVQYHNLHKAKLSSSRANYPKLNIWFSFINSFDFLKRLGALLCFYTQHHTHGLPSRTQSVPFHYAWFFWDDHTASAFPKLLRSPIANGLSLGTLALPEGCKSQLFPHYPFMFLKPLLPG